jgi:hypothetical protein
MMCWCSYYFIQDYYKIWKIGAAGQMIRSMYGGSKQKEDRNGVDNHCLGRKQSVSHPGKSQIAEVKTLTPTRRCC